MKQFRFFFILITAVGLLCTACGFAEPKIIHPANCPADCKVIQVELGSILATLAEKVEITWGDGTVSTHLRSDKMEHTYLQPGEYTIIIKFIKDEAQMGRIRTLNITIP